MRIKPVIDKIKADGFFSEVKVSKSLPTAEQIKNAKIELPICYLLPVKDTGNGLSSQNRPRQRIGFLYSICIVAESGDEDCSSEPPMTLAKESLLNSLLGFVITQDYEGLAFHEGQIIDRDKNIELWTCGYQTQKTFTKV